MEQAGQNIVPTQSAPNLTRSRVALALVVPALALWALVASFFAVDVTEFGLVTRFGAVVRVVTDPGLHMKAPFDRIVRVDKRLSFSRPPAAEYLTVDKRNVVVESLATWRIADPHRFIATLVTRSNADVRLADIVLSEIGAVLGKYPASTLIAPDANAQRFRKIVSEIRERVAIFARTAYGMDIVDVELIRLALPEQNREHVFDRMKAERGKMAKEYRTAGELLSRKIIAEADRERTQIESEAYAQSQRIKAEGDAEASRVYATTFSQNPAFYKFLRTLQAYERFMDESTTLFLPADAEVLRLLAQPGKWGSAPEDRPSTTVTAKTHDPAPAGSIARPGALGAGSAPAAELARPSDQKAQ